MSPTDWSQLRPLPRLKVSHHRGKRLETWPEISVRYAAMEKQPLIITAELVTPIIHAEQAGTHLDSILSFAALTALPMQSEFGDGACVVPLPLHLAFVSAQGLPLWACTPLMPKESVEGREYWHKRYPTQRADFGSKQLANTSAGRWREYRVPLRTDSTSALHALCIGNQAEIERLLAYVSHIGKKGTQGFGRVARWTVTPAAHEVNDVLAMRAVPVEYFAGRPPVGVMSPSRAWTPPYWFAPWWSACMVPG